MRFPRKSATCCHPFPKCLSPQLHDLREQRRPDRLRQYLCPSWSLVHIGRPAIARSPSTCVRSWLCCWSDLAPWEHSDQPGRLPLAAEDSDPCCSVTIVVCPGQHPQATFERRLPPRTLHIPTR